MVFFHIWCNLFQRLICHSFLGLSLISGFPIKAPKQTPCFCSMRPILWFVEWFAYLSEITGIQWSCDSTSNSAPKVPKK